MKSVYEKPTLTMLPSILHMEGLEGDSQHDDVNDESND